MNYDRTRISQQYLLREYPQENARCEWKEFKNLKNSFCGDEKDDVISYVSSVANMEGGFLVVGVHDKTLEIVGTDTYNYDRQKAILRLTERCTNLSSEGLDIEEYITDDSRKVVWVIHWLHMGHSATTPHPCLSLLHTHTSYTWHLTI